MSLAAFIPARSRLTAGAPPMVLIPRERVGLTDRPALPLPPPVAPVYSPAPLPRLPVGLAPVDPAEAGATLRPPVKPVVQAMADATGFPVKAITGPLRTAPLSRARQAAYFVARRFTGRTLQEVGQAMGGRDHSTVLHGCRKVEALVAMIGPPRSDTVEGWTGHLVGHDWKTGKVLSR